LTSALPKQHSPCRAGCPEKKHLQSQQPSTATSCAYLYGAGTEPSFRCTGGRARQTRRFQTLWLPWPARCRLQTSRTGIRHISTALPSCNRGMPHIRVQTPVTYVLGEHLRAPKQRHQGRVTSADRCTRALSSNFGKEAIIEVTRKRSSSRRQRLSSRSDRACCASSLGPSPHTC